MERVMLSREGELMEVGLEREEEEGMKGGVGRREGEENEGGVGKKDEVGKQERVESGSIGELEGERMEKRSGEWGRNKDERRMGWEKVYEWKSGDE